MGQAQGIPDGLDSYGLDYRETKLTTAVADHGIRASDHYVDTHDLLRATAIVGAQTAQVQLGVDPGTFFCGAQLAELLRLRARAAPNPLRVGFIHVPPDRSTGADAQAKSQLHRRATNLEMIAQVVAVALRGFTPNTDAALVISGFGSFRGVADNPTAEFVTDRANLDRMVMLAHPGATLAPSQRLRASSATSAELHEYHLAGDSPRRLRLFSALLGLAPTEEDALAGRYYDSESVAANFDRLIELIAEANDGRGPAAILSLGVDSTQSTGTRTPRFKIETQTRGWHRRGEPGRSATKEFQRDLELAQVFITARAHSSPPLHYQE